METRQKYLELRKVFNEIIEEKVRNYLKEKPYQLKETEDSDSKIVFFKIKGYMLSFSKYELRESEDGSNEEAKQSEEIIIHEAPTIIIPDESPEGSTFWLHLEHPDIEHDDQSYFFEETHNKAAMFCIYNEKMLHDEKFQEVIMQMIEEIAPERKEEVQQLFQ